MADIVKKGARGEDVKQVQEGLNRLGFGLATDGVFGDATYNAVITLQMIFGYDADGIVGPATRKLMESQAGYGWNLQAARKAFVQKQPQA